MKLFCTCDCHTKAYLGCSKCIDPNINHDIMQDETTTPVEEVEETEETEEETEE